MPYKQQSELLPPFFILIVIFNTNFHQLVPPLVSFPICFGTEPMGIISTGFYRLDALPTTNQECQSIRMRKHTWYTHTFNGPFSGITQVSRYRKGKTNLDFTEARDSEWQRHQLGHMQVCTSLQTDNHASTQPLSFFTGRMPFLLPNQQRQSTEGMVCQSKR